MQGIYSYRMVVCTASNTGQAEAQQAARQNAPGRTEKESGLNRARLILADGTEYRGVVTAGQNNKRFHKSGNNISLKFEINS